MADGKPFDLIIGFKSGREVKMRVTDWSVSENSMSGELTKLSWTLHDPTKQRVPYIRAAEIESIEARY